MRCKALICDVLSRDFYYYSSLTDNIVDIELMDSYNHLYPKKMKESIQKKIDNVDSSKYDYILMGFGLCGNALNGIQSRDIEIVVPKVHDCITLFIGSKERYQEYFEESSSSMYYISSWIEKNGINQDMQDLKSIGLGESYEYYEQKYGKKGAKYLSQIAKEWIRRYNKAVYVTNKLVKEDYSHDVLNICKKRQWNFEEIKGNSCIIENLINGDWNENEFLVVEKNSRIYSTGDDHIVDYEYVQS